MRIIYGASVSSGTCEELAKMADVDGFFVGAAAWSADEFEAIAKSVKVKKVCFLLSPIWNQAGCLPAITN